MPEAVIVDAVRSPIGRAFKGSLTGIRPDDPRAKAITTTPAGRQKAHAALLVVEKTDCAFFAADAPRLIAVLKSLSKRSADRGKPESSTAGPRSRA